MRRRPLLARISLALLTVTTSLLLIGRTEAVAINNGVVGEPDVQCGSESITLLFKAQQPFHGKVFVKGFASDPHCALAGTGRIEHRFDIRFDECGVRRIREINGVSIVSTVIVSFHSVFLTAVDRAYHLNCFYMEANKLVTQQLDVSQLTTQLIQGQTEMPICKYEILSTGPNGAPVRYARLGDSVFHKWSCVANLDDLYCMKVHSCTVTDGQGGEVVDVINEGGCTEDSIILPNLKYLDDLTAGQFADRATLYFNCQLQLALKDPVHGCASAQPKCSTTTSTETSSSPGADVAVEANSDEGSPSSMPSRTPSRVPAARPTAESYDEEGEEEETDVTVTTTLQTTTERTTPSTTTSTEAPTTTIVTQPFTTSSSLYLEATTPSTTQTTSAWTTTTTPPPYSQVETTSEAYSTSMSSAPPVSYSASAGTSQPTQPTAGEIGVQPASQTAEQAEEAASAQTTTTTTEGQISVKPASKTAEEAEEYGEEVGTTSTTTVRSSSFESESAEKVEVSPASQPSKEEYEEEEGESTDPFAMSSATAKAPEAPQPPPTITTTQTPLPFVAEGNPYEEEAKAATPPPGPPGIEPTFEYQLDNNAATTTTTLPTTPVRIVAAGYGEETTKSPYRRKREVIRRGSLAQQLNGASEVTNKSRTGEVKERNSNAVADFDLPEIGLVVFGLEDEPPASGNLYPDSVAEFYAKSRPIERTCFSTIHLVCGGLVLGVLFMLLLTLLLVVWRQRRQLRNPYWIQ